MAKTLFQPTLVLWQKFHFNNNGPDEINLCGWVIDVTLRVPSFTYVVS